MNTMKKTSLILVLFFLSPIAVYCQYNLKIEISPLKNNEGQVILAFMDENENILKQLTAEIEENKCIFVIDSLGKGKYAFKYIHDENNNNKLDTKLFILPKEGYGFSNDAKGKFGPPPFKDMIFEIKMDSTIICKPSY